MRGILSSPVRWRETQKGMQAVPEVPLGAGQSSNSGTGGNRVEGCGRPQGKILPEDLFGSHEMVPPARPILARVGFGVKTAENVGW